MSILNDSEKTSLPQVAPRLLQILRVLARHKVLGALLGKDHLPSPRVLRETLQELGVTFLKFGQVLAMQPELLPAPYIKELKLLHDELPAMDFKTTRAAVESRLGAPLTELFSEFGEVPLAAATIAQVHEATTKDGRHVAVKVQRPGLGPVISRDIAVLRYLTALGESLDPRIRPFDLPSAVREFNTSLHRELDFTREARSASLFRAALEDVPEVWIPGVVAELSNESILTLEFSAGERVDLFGKAHPEAMPGSINTLVELMLHTIFEEGIFHADPHPGNVFVLPDGRLSLLDFGNTGELDESMRESLILLLDAVVKNDAKAATEAYLEMIPASENVDHASLVVDIRAALYDINRSELANGSIGDAFESLLRAGSRNGVRNPVEFLLLARTFVILESISHQLSPDHDYMESFRKEIARLTKQHFSLERIEEKTTKLARELERLTNDGPGDMRRVLRRIAQGDLGRVQAPAVESLGIRVSNDLGRLSKAIAFAGLVVGGSLLFLAGPGWHHTLGEVMVVTGFTGMLLIPVGDWLRARARR